MCVMLADSIDGGILVLLMIIGGVVTCVPALCALVPASKGNRKLTFLLVAPALVYGALITLNCAQGFFNYDRDDPGFLLNAVIVPWLLMAGPPLAMGLLALFVLRRKKSKMD